MNNEGDIERPVNNTTPSKITDYFPPSPKSKQTQLDTSKDSTSNGIYLYISIFIISP